MYIYNINIYTSGPNKQRNACIPIGQYVYNWTAARRFYIVVQMYKDNVTNNRHSLTRMLSQSKLT